MLGRSLLRTRRMWFSTARRIPVPAMGDSITEGQVIEILAGVGSSVKVDEVIAVLETDKVSVDVTSPCAGTVKSVDAAAGDILQVGDTLMHVNEGAEATELEESVASTSNAEAKTESKEVKQDLVEEVDVESFNVDIPRNPSIQFRYGTREKVAASPAKVSSSPSKPAYTGEVGAPEDFVSASRLSEEEIEAVLSGGASLLD